MDFLMANKFVISDTHFFHTNTWQKFKRDDGTPLRHFTSTEEMNETMINNWNALVQHGDTVYHGGDVTWNYGKEFRELMHRLNGRKILIFGNHDRLSKKVPVLLDFFERIELWKGFHELGTTFTHIPIPIDSLRDGDINCHGHTHYNQILDSFRNPDPRYVNLCVEMIDYAPVPFDVLGDILTERRRIIKNG
jgi:calcineurin-like phosphoesterase family protein